MRAFSYEWSLPVTRQRWRSHSSIRHSRKPYATRTLSGSTFYITTELLPIEVLHCGIGILDCFAPVTLTLTSWPSYMNLTRILSRYNGYANKNFLRQGFRKLSSDRHTDRQTQPKSYHASSRVVSECLAMAMTTMMTLYYWLFFNRRR